MDSRTNTSYMSPSWMPVFDVRHHSHQDGQDWLSGWNSDETNALTNTRHAAGSVGASPFPSPSPHTSAIYSFDQWAALLNADRYSNVYASRFPGAPNFGPSPNFGFQDSELSSCYSPTPPSSISSPLGDDVSLYLTSPEQFLRGSYSPFSMGAVGGSDPVAPAQPLEHSMAPSHNPTPEPWPTASGQPLLPLVSLPDELTTTGVPGLTTNNANALPGTFLADPAAIETTALGLYYPEMALCLDAPPFPTQAENNASAPSVPERFPRPAPPAPPLPVKWTFRAVDPSPKALSSKRVRGDKTQPPPSSFADGSSHDDADADSDTAGEALIKCEECGYVQSKRRMGDFRRHLKKHDAEHLTRVICCGVPPAHPAVARLRPGHHLSPRWYGDRPFYGGCGRSYSRMDALQRHLKKSHCVGGTTRDHQAWRRLYFSHQTRYPH